jgi:FkbM family methyltransferase
MALKGFIITIIILIILLLIASVVIYFLIRNNNKSKNFLGVKNESNNIHVSSSVGFSNENSIQISGKTMESSRYLIVDDLYQKDWFEKKKNIFQNMNVIFDCGAHIGDWTSMITDVFPLATYYCFEPTDSSFERMIHNLRNKKQNIIFENILLGNINDQEVKFYQSLKNCDSGNSIFKENTDHFKLESIDYEIIKKKTKRLDTYLRDKNIDKIDLLKLDTQGSEMMILEGLGKRIDDVKSIIIEVSNLDYNRNSPSYIEIIQFLLKNNFTLYDILQLHYYGNILNQMNIIFVRNQFPTLQIVKNTLKN